MLKLTKEIALKENADVEVCILSAYLHDIIDVKLTLNVEETKEEIITL